MRLTRVRLENFRAIRAADIPFGASALDPNRGPAIDFLVGRNGTGKSSVLEAVALIFGSLALDVDPGFAYLVEYEAKGESYRVEVGQADARARRPVAWRLTAGGTWRPLPSGERPVLPDRVIGYSGGPGKGLNSALVASIDSHLRSLWELRDDEPAAETLPAEERQRYTKAREQSMIDQRHALTDAPLTAFLDNATAVCAALALIAHPGVDPAYREGRRTVLDRLGLDQGHPIVAISFRVRADWQSRLSPLSAAALARVIEHAWPRTAVETEDETRDPDYYAVIDFDTEWQHRGLPELVGTPITFVDNLLAWTRSGAAKIEAIVRKPGVADILPLSTLSDGELLYAARYGLLLVVPKEIEALVLLDEPETHFNDAWKVSLVRDCRQALGPASPHHLIVATHSDLTLTDADGVAVHILRKNASVETPAVSPFAAARSEIARSLFGVEAEVGAYAREVVDAAIERNDLQELRHLVSDVVGPGRTRFALIDRLVALEDAGKEHPG